MREDETRNFLYKHASKIFWIIVALDIFGFISRHNIFGLFQAFSLVVSYFLFKKNTKDYWFNVSYLAFSLNGAIWFFYVWGLHSQFFLKGIISSIVYLLFTIGGYYYFKKKHNKVIAWILYFIAFFAVIWIQLHG